VSAAERLDGDPTPPPEGGRVELVSTGIDAAVMTVVGLLVAWYSKGRFDGVERRMDRMESRFDAWFDRLDARFDRLENRFDAHVDRSSP
jgi:hypothetical protein